MRAIVYSSYETSASHGHVEARAPLQEGKLDQCRRGGHHSADLTQQCDAGSHRATGGEQIVHHHHALSRLHGIGLHLDAIGSVFQGIVQPHRLARQLAALAEHDEAAAQLERERRGDQEAAAFDPGEQVGLVCAHRLCHATHRHLPGIGVPQQGGDVVEQDPRLGEIRDAPDVVLEVHAPEAFRSEGLARQARL